MRHPYVHEMFCEIVSRYPDSLAIESVDGSWTYAELDRRSAGTAASLAAAGVLKNEIVVIFGNDRKFIIQAILGVLRRGSAFLPILPDIPEKRLESMLQQCSPHWALVQPECVRQFSDAAARHSVQVVPNQPPANYRLEECCPVLEEEDGDGLSYIFFTSGSTGTPKAIAGRLKAIDHFIRWEIETFGLGAEIRVSQLISPMFDAFLRDVFVPLCAGGTLCLPPQPELAFDGEELAQWLEREAIALVHTVPSVFRMMINQCDPATSFVGIRYVLLAGEPLLPADVNKWYELAGTAEGRLVNLYGPTETTMTKFFYVVNPEDQWRRTIPIGNPMRGAKAVVLDKNLRPCPPGKVGEIYIRTPYRTLGYYRQPDLTAEVFISNPFTEDPQDLVYKTGDLGRVVDGKFELVGRADDQVKLHGFRIELGEIEAALSEHPDVAQAAVSVRESHLGDRRLVAYIVKKDGVPEPAPADLRSHLRERLPAPMLPAAFVLMNELPLNANGKVDRKRLPDPDENRKEGGYRAPFTPYEELLCGIWEEVLKLERVGADANFFTLGGHSLLATQLMSRIRKAFSAELSLRTLFEAPTPATLARRIEQEIARQEKVEFPLLRRGWRKGPIPLSSAQQRLWFIDQLELGSSSYNMPRALRVRGPLEIGLLKKVMVEIIRRHESLRTRFTSVDGVPQQIVDQEIRFDLPLIDLSSLPEEIREEEAHRLTRQELLLPFNLERGPLLRVVAFRLAEQEHVLQVTMHHIISDAWSLGIFVHEVSVLWQAFSAGQPSPLPELPIQYPDFAQWQRQWLTTEVLDSKIEYWKNQLADLPALELPVDYPRPLHASTQNARVSVEISPQLTQRLNEFNRRQGVTLFMTLLGAFQLLLGRYCGQKDLAVGTVVAGRTHLETEPLIGFFVNMLVLRSRLQSTIPFNDFLRQVRGTVLDAHAHQDVPFDLLVEKLVPERVLGESPLFQAMLALQNTPRPSLQLPGVELSGWESGHRAARFDLVLGLAPHEDGMAATLEYAAELFSPERMERFAQTFVMLLEHLVAAPEKQLWEVPLMSQAERRHVLEEWNQTEEPIPALCVHELFEAQAARRPHAIAVTFEHGRYSYEELNARANQVAHFLRGRGVGLETRVAICCERGPELIVGMLGIMKVGAAYVPLDPGYPVERLAWMLDDSGAGALLIQQELAKRLPTHWIQMIVLDEEKEAIEEESTNNMAGTGAEPETLAYVMYTSGSTGEPKGVGVEHRAIVRLVRGRRGFQVGESDVLVLLSPVTFDASTLEIWGALANGARLALYPPEIPSLEELGVYLKKNEVSMLWLTAGVFHQMVEKNVEGLHGIRQLLTGGDVVSAQHVRAAAQVLPRCALINGYGPTENTTFTTCYRIQGDPGEISNFPIGEPISNTQVYVVDEEMRPVPVGVVGELYTGGAGLSRGYLGRPRLTAERYVPDELSGKPGVRLYRTGDRVRWRSDGNLEYIGRIDNQVKVRGYRIELGEIEAVVQQHPEVRQAVVIAREEGAEDKRLVAYVVPEPGASDLSKESLKSYLVHRLPEFMVPAAFVLLPELPLTAHGKLERRKLPAPDYGRQILDVEEIRTPTEEILVDIWCEVLKLTSIRVDENFFDVGGHSLLATQVISRARDIFGIELPLRALFEAPTIAGFARQIEGGFTQNRREEIPPIVPVLRTSPIPLSFAQQRLWFIHQLEPNSIAYNIPLALRLHGPLDLDAMRRTVEEIVRRHEVLRTSFVMEKGEPRQHITHSVAIPLEVEDLRAESEERRETYAREVLIAQASRPFDLERGPLVRVMLVRLAEDDHIFQVILHHACTDGWSLGILIREFTQLYQAFVQGLPSPLKELPLQYADFACWQRQWLVGDVLQEQLEFWRNQLSGVPVLELPTDYPRPLQPSGRGAWMEIKVALELTRQLESLSRQCGVTLFMTMLSALQLVLGRHSGQDDVAVGTAIANRTRLDTESVIGFFVNTLVLRSRFEKGASFSDLLKRVRSTVLEAYAHQELPFDRLVEELAPERKLGQTPLFQVMFVFQNMPRETFSLPGLQMGPWESDQTPAKFDLWLSLMPGPQGLEGTLVFSTDLFTRERMERLLGHYLTLLQEVVKDPGIHLWEIPLLSDVERTALVEWNRTEMDFPRLCVHHLFEQQVSRTPDALALRAYGRQLTFTDLNQRANQLSHYLRELGVGLENRVGLFLERTIEMEIGLLAILKAGGAYVPLDPAYPADHLNYIIEDAGIEVVLTTSAPSRRLRPGRARVVLLDAEWDEISRCPEENPRVVMWPENLMYVLYTSGSTGRAKGVLGLHSGAVNRFAWMWERYPFTEEEVCCQKTRPGFLDSLSELLVPLLRGIPVIIVSEEDGKDPLALTTLLAAENVSRIVLVPSLLKLLLETQEDLRKSVPRLDFWVTSGEALPVETWADFSRSMSGSRILNLYGSTEISADATWAELGEYCAGAGVSIGRPIANMRAYVLDSHMVQVAVGVPGELYIGGVGLARGYLNRRALTAERFVPDLFGSSGERMFRTGDRAVRRADGSLEFLGRVDNLIKLRGNRIEPAEVEAVLVGHPCVRQAAVVAREDATGEKRLVAYLVCEDGSFQSNNVELTSTLQKYVQERLPDYMVPTSYMALDSLPLLPNGKLDRRALLGPLGEAPVPSHIESLGPRNTLEADLQQIWSDVLGKADFGIRDNFFRIGGHSMKAAVLVTRIGKKFGKAVPVRFVFDKPTIEEQAAFFSGEAIMHLPGCLSPIQKRGTRHPLFCVHPLGGLAFCYERLSSLLGTDQPLYGLESHGQEEGQLPLTTIPEMASLYIRSIQAIQPAGPYQLAGFSMGAVIAYEMAQQLTASGEIVSLLALLDQRPLLPPKALPGSLPKSEWEKEVSQRAEVHLVLMAKQQLGFSDEELQDMDPDERIHQYLNGLKTTGRVRESLSIDQLRRHLRIAAVNELAIESYQPQPYEGHLVLFRVPSSENEDKSYGWENLAPGRVEILEVPGVHAEFMSEPSVNILAAKLGVFLKASDIATETEEWSALAAQGHR